MIEARFHSALSRLAPPPHTHLRVALSGGSDSVALLSLLTRWREGHRQDLTISAGHIDHRLRADSDEDADHCGTICTALGIELRIDRCDVEDRARRDRESIETAGRSARLATFRRWIEEDGVDAVLTAHHQDDQVETILARLLRGSGLGGLSGIPVRRPISPNCAGELWRPLLEFTREELSAYRSALGLIHAEDPTNASTEPTRNRIRHELLPLLRSAFNPAVDRAILALAAEASEVVRARREIAARPRSACIVQPPHAAVPPSALRALVSDLGGRSVLLEEIWNEVRGVPGGLTRAHHALWHRIAEGRGQGRAVPLPEGRTLGRAGGWLWLLGPGSAPGPALAPQRLSPGDEIRFRGGSVRIDREGTAGKAPPPAGRLSRSLPANVPLWVRGARRGDRLRHTEGSSRVDELLRQAGVPSAYRAEYPVIATEGDEEETRDVLWVPGVRPPRPGGDCIVSFTPDSGPDPLAFILRVRAKDNPSSA